MPAIDNYFPVGTNLICEPIESDAKVGSIIIPETVRGRVQSNSAIVLKVGPDISARDILTPGRIIIHGIHTEMGITFGRERFVILNESDIVAYGPIAEEQPLTEKKDGIDKQS